MKLWETRARLSGWAKAGRLMILAGVAIFILTGYSEVVEESELIGSYADERALRRGTRQAPPAMQMYADYDYNAMLCYDSVRLATHHSITFQKWYMVGLGVALLGLYIVHAESLARRRREGIT